MTDAITYRDMIASIRFDARDDIFVGRLLGVEDVIGFHADNVADLRSAFHEVVDEYLEEHDGETMRRYSGKVMLRLDSVEHRLAAVAAAAAGKSINQWGREAFEEKAKRDLGDAVAF